MDAFSARPGWCGRGLAMLQGACTSLIQALEESIQVIQCPSAGAPVRLLHWASPWTGSCRTLVFDLSQRQG